MQIRTATQADHPNVMVFYDAMNAEIGRRFSTSNTGVGFLRMI